MGVRPIKSSAYKMRLEGHSYNEISSTLGTPKSTLSTWFRGVVLSSKAQKRLADRTHEGAMRGLLKRNRLQTHTAQQLARSIQSQASAKVSQLDKEDLLLVGALLYWAEGYKRTKIRNGKELTSHPISFVNSDPDMIQAFVAFLILVLKIGGEDIRLTMRLYTHINESEARKYWKRVTGLHVENFRNSTFLVTGASRGKRPFNRLPFGTLQVAVYNTKKFHELIGLINGVKNRIENDIVRTLPG